MATFEDKFEKIRQLALLPLEEILVENGKSKLNASTYAQVSKLTYELAAREDERLYKALVAQIEAFYSRIVSDSLQRMHGEALLREFVRHGENQEMIGRFYRTQFELLGRNYIKRTKSRTFDDISRSSFQAIIYNSVKQSLADELLRIIQQIREGNDVDRLLVKDTVRFIATLGSRMFQCYEEDFERVFLQQSCEFYGVCALEWQERDTAADYLQKSDAALQKEKHLVASLLHPMTDAKVQYALERKLLHDKVVALMERENNGLRYLLRTNRTQDIALFYKFVVRVGQGMEELARIFRRFIEEQSQQIWAARLSKEQNWSKEQGSLDEDGDMMRTIFTAYATWHQLLTVQFAGHSKARDALKRGVEYLVNYVAPGSPQKVLFVHLLANFCDALLRKQTGDKKMEEKECEQLLEQVVLLFAHLQDKDIFRTAYQQALAQRLLNQTSASDDMERAMIGHFKLISGQAFTANFEVMLFDVMNSKEQNEKFQDEFYQQQKATERPIAELAVQVLTYGQWPSYQPMDRLRLPNPMQEAMKLFTTYFMHKQDGKRLVWIHELGQVTVQGKWPGQARPFQFLMTPIQATLLMLFSSTNESDTSDTTATSGSVGRRWTIGQIAQAVNLDEDVVPRVLSTMVFSKVKLLNRDRVAKENTIKSDDTFSVNLDFTSKVTRLKLPAPNLTVITKKSQEEVDEQRRLVTEACVVRIMKARKTLLHTTLTSEVLNQLQLFRPEGAMIKKVIESLIERDYLRRDPDNMSQYVYVA